jgi:hypothetical protein
MTILQSFLYNITIALRSPFNNITLILQSPYNSMITLQPSVMWQSNLLGIFVSYKQNEVNNITPESVLIFLKIVISNSLSCFSSDDQWTKSLKNQFWVS